MVAERTGVPVVSNFRSRDIAAGGQGAPLVPFVDYLLFRHRTRTRIALNIGGIANITIIPPAAGSSEVVAFDTGPGNMVIDALVTQFTNGRERFDRDGKIAASGTIDRSLLRELLKDSYYRRRPPKSAGREQYGTEFVERLKASGRALPDLIATATALTAATISGAVETHAQRARPGGPARTRGSAPLGNTDLVVAGGGVHNRQLMGQIGAFVHPVRVTTTEEFGIDPDAKEAIAFAVLAHHTWRRKASNLPSATGARHPVILGCLTIG